MVSRRCRTGAKPGPQLLKFAPKSWAKKECRKIGLFPEKSGAFGGQRPHRDRTFTRARSRAKRRAKRTAGPVNPPPRSAGARRATGATQRAPNRRRHSGRTSGHSNRTATAHLRAREAAQNNARSAPRARSTPRRGRRGQGAPPAQRSGPPAAQSAPAERPTGSRSPRSVAIVRGCLTAATKGQRNALRAAAKA